MRKIRNIVVVLCIFASACVFADEKEFHAAQKCNELQNAVQMLCNQRSWDLFQIARHDTKSQEYWYMLGQVEGLNQAHEEILKVMDWYGHHPK